MDAPEYDIFLSYASKDCTSTDQRPMNAEKVLDWIAYLVYRIEEIVRSNVVLRAEVPVWRDVKGLKGNYNLSDIYAALDKTRLLVAILSNNFTDSDHCPAEFGHFRARVKKESAEWQRRIFHVFRAPLDSAAWMREIGSDSRSFRFFDPDTGEFFDPSFSRGSQDRFEREVMSLGMAIVHELKSKPALASRGTVYFPIPPGEKVRHICRSAREELVDRGFTVLPEGDFSAEKADVARGQISRCDACVLVVEPVSADVVEHPIERDFGIALEMCHETKRPVLALLPVEPTAGPGLGKGEAGAGAPPAPAFHSFIRRLSGKRAGEREDCPPGLQVRRQFVWNFKPLLFEWLDQVRQRQSSKPSCEGALLCHRCDAENTELSLLQEAVKPLRLELPEFSGSVAERRAAEQRHLEKSELLVVYSHLSSREWLRNKLSKIASRVGSPGQKVAVLLIGDDRGFEREFPAALRRKPGELTVEELRTWLAGLP